MRHGKGLALVAGVLLPAAMASAASILTLQQVSPGPGPITPGTPVVVAVNIAGGDSINAMGVLLLIGDGGPNAGGTDPIATNPRFVGGSSTVGTIFAANNTGDQFFTLGGGPDLAGGNQQVTATFPTGVTGTGVLALFNIDTTGIPSGTYIVDINIDNTSLNGGAVPFTTGAPLSLLIPEPASALLLLGALPFLRRRSA